MGIMNNNSINLPLTVKIAKFMYYCKNSIWEGSCKELAVKFMIQSTDKLDLNSQIVHAITVLKKEGILTEESGFVENYKDKILLQLVE